MKKRRLTKFSSVPSSISSDTTGILSSNSQSIKVDSDITYKCEGAMAELGYGARLLP